MGISVWTSLKGTGLDFYTEISTALHCLLLVTSCPGGLYQTAHDSLLLKASLRSLRSLALKNYSLDLRFQADYKCTDENNLNNETSKHPLTCKL